MLIAQVLLLSPHLQYADLWYANLSGAFLGGADLGGSFLPYTDLRPAENLTPKQLEGENPPFLCNAALPKGFTVNPDRDCNRLPQVLFERHPEEFKTLKDAEVFVNRIRQFKWTDEPPPVK